MVLHGEDAYCYDKEEGDDNRNGHIATKLYECPIRQSADDARHSVYLLLEDDGDVVQQHVADDTACRPRYGTHDYSHPEGVTAVECLLQAGYGEERQAERVEEEPRIVKTLQRSRKDDDEHLRHERTDEINRGSHPERRYAEHYIAQRTSTDSHGNATYEASEPVEALGCCMTDARDSKGEGTQKLNNVK